VKKYTLTLFVTGNSPRSERAVQNLLHLCEETLTDQYEVTIIDVLEQPALAEEVNIFATPTVVKMTPLPVKRVIGDLSEPARVIQGLGL
jgi:circadian clock protein KaiB